MIELRIDQTEVNKIQHTVTHSLTMIKMIKEAGVPISGVLITHGIYHGTLEWANEDGLDGPEHVIRWWADGEPSDLPLTVEAKGHGHAFTWVRYANPNAPQPDEDEL